MGVIIKLSFRWYCNADPVKLKAYGETSILMSIDEVKALAGRDASGKVQR